MKNLINTNLSELVEIKNKYNSENETQLVQALTHYLKNIGFRDSIILSNIILTDDKEGYKEFLQTHKDIQIDLNGNQQLVFKWWEPLIELNDALYQVSQREITKSPRSKSIIDAYELNNAEEYLKNNTELGDFEDNLKEFISMHELSYDEGDINTYISKIDSVMNKKENISIKPVLSAVLLFYMNRKDYRTVNLIISRLSYLSGDKKLRHPSNKYFYERLRNLAYLANNSNN